MFGIVWLAFAVVACGDEIRVNDLVVCKRDNQILVNKKHPHPVVAGQELIVLKVNANQLFVDTGEQKGWIPSDLVDVSNRPHKSVSFTLHYKIIPGKSTSRVQFVSNLPRNIPGRQTVLELNYSIEPHKSFTKNGTDYAFYEFAKPKTPVDIKIDIKANIYRYDLETARKTGRPKETDTARWLISERFLESDAEEIKKAADQIPERDTLSTASDIMSFVQKTLKVASFRSKQFGAVGALKEKQGDCTEFADLFVALCRAKNIPARNCDGYLMVQPKEGDTVRHKWVEFYSPRHGWVPIDPMQIEMGNTTFQAMHNEYVYASNLRNDPTIGKYEFSQYTYWGDPITMEDNVTVHR